MECKCGGVTRSHTYKTKTDGMTHYVDTCNGCGRRHEIKTKTERENEPHGSELVDGWIKVREVID